MRSRRVLMLACIAVAVAVCLASRLSAALPAGRGWAPATELSFPRVLDIGFPRLEADTLGSPILWASALWDTSPPRCERFVARAWQDSAWISPRLSSLYYGPFPEPVVSSTSRVFAAWTSWGCPVNYDYVPVVISEILPDRMAEPDTAMIVVDGDVEWGAAASRTRRWVARQDWRFPSSWRVRTAYSDTARVWHELPMLGIDEDHCTIAPLSEHSAMMVYVGESGLAWARAVDGTWVEQGVLDPRPWTAAHPKLRIRPSGGLWLLWTERTQVHVSMYDGTRWWRGDSLVAAHPAGQTFWAAWCDASRDGAERPVLVWVDLGYGYTYRNVLSISVPDDHGWPTGEEIPGSEGHFTPIPTTMRDRNGDVWVAWARIGGVDVDAGFIHTYCKAVTGPPRVVGAGRQRAVAWDLSEPAPGSWWTVLRARFDGPFEPVARLQADSTLSLSWRDDSPPAGLLRYKLRRECLDARYQWESPQAAWPAAARAPIYLGPPQPPGQGDDAEPGLTATPEDRQLGRLRLSLGAAQPGPVTLRAYDLQGRLVLEQQVMARGTARETVTLDFRQAGQPLASGIYFARATDAAGNASATVRVVILR